MLVFRAEIVEEHGRYIWKGLRTKIQPDKVRYGSAKGASDGAERFSRECKLDCKVTIARKELKRD